MKWNLTVFGKQRKNITLNYCGTNCCINTVSGDKIFIIKINLNPEFSKYNTKATNETKFH